MKVNKTIKEDVNNIEGLPSGVRDLSSTFKNYKAFAANFKPVYIVKINKNFFVYKQDAKDYNSYIYNSDSKENIDGWLYGAVQAKNKVIAEALKIKETYQAKIEHAKKFKYAKKLTESKKSLKEAMSRDEAFDEIFDIINGKNSSDQVWLWNNYCEEAGYTDDMVYSMDDLDEILDGIKPWDALRMAFYGDFKPVHNFWRFNGYGNLESFDYADSFMDIEAMADYVIDNENSFGDDDIEAVLEAMNDMDESVDRKKIVKIKEDIENLETTETTTTVPQPTGAAKEESKTLWQRFEEATKEPEDAPLFGAKKQPVPDEAEEPKAELKEDWRDTVGIDSSFEDFKDIVDKIERDGKADCREILYDIVYKMPDYKRADILNMLAKQYGEEGLKESLKKKSSTKLTLDESLFESKKPLKERMYDLNPEHDGRGSFYGKAKVLLKGNDVTLYSYNTPIVRYNVSDGKVVRLCDVNLLSATTLRHLREFIQQAVDDGAIQGIKQVNKAWFASLPEGSVDESLKESVDNFPTKEDVKDRLFNAVGDVFGYYQDSLGIEYGDIAPEDDFELDDLEDSMADLILRVLKYEKYGFDDEDNYEPKLTRDDMNGGQWYESLNKKRIKENYSIVDLDTGDSFGNFDSADSAKSKAQRYSQQCKAKCAVVDDRFNVVCGYVDGKERRVTESLKKRLKESTAYILSWKRKNGDVVKDQRYTAEHISRQLSQLEKEGATDIKLYSIDTTNESLKKKYIKTKNTPKKLLKEALVTRDFSEYRPWSGAVDTYRKIEEAGMLDDLERLIDESYDGVIGETELNDILWFDSDWVFEYLGLQEEDDEDMDESLKKGKRNLKEEVSDIAYQMAEEIDERFKAQGFIAWDDFNEAFEDAYPGLIDWDDDSFNDLETDVRGILSYMGWETIYEGEDEGGLKLLESKSIKGKKNLKEASTLPKGGKDEVFDTDDWSVIYWELSGESEGTSQSAKLKKRAKVDVDNKAKYSHVDPVNDYDLRVYGAEEKDFDLAKKIADAWELKYKIEETNKTHANKNPKEKLQMTIYIPEDRIG